jgi:hypothetical protein
VIELSGPRDLTSRDVAEALARVTAKPVKLEVGAEQAIVPALQSAGLNAHWAELFAELTRSINAGTLVWEGRGARAARGTTSIDEVLASLVAK